MGSGAGHRRPSVRIAAPTGRVRRRGCALRCRTAARCPDEEECTLRSVGARARKVQCSHRGDATAPRMVDAREPSFWARGARQGPCRRRQAATPGATDALVETCARGRSPCRRGRVDTVSRWSDGEMKQARAAGRPALVLAAERHGVHGARGVPDDSYLSAALIDGRSRPDTPAPTRSARNVCSAPDRRSMWPRHPRSRSTGDTGCRRVHTARRAARHRTARSGERAHGHDATQLRIALALAA
jgi:hypothetical protein